MKVSKYIKMYSNTKIQMRRRDCSLSIIITIKKKVLQKNTFVYIYVLVYIKWFNMRIYLKTFLKKYSSSVFECIVYLFDYIYIKKYTNIYSNEAFIFVFVYKHPLIYEKTSKLFNASTKMYFYIFSMHYSKEKKFI